VYKYPFKKRSVRPFAEREGCSLFVVPPPALNWRTGRPIGDIEMAHRPLAALALASCLGFAGPAAAAGQAAARAPVDFRTSCARVVRGDFTAAVTLLHHMTYPQARTAFAAIAKKDPGCAMARWGLAMTLFQPLWPNRPGKADLQLGWTTAQEGLALKA